MQKLGRRFVLAVAVVACSLACASGAAHATPARAAAPAVAAPISSKLLLKGFGKQFGTGLIQGLAGSLVQAGLSQIPGLGSLFGGDDGTAAALAQIQAQLQQISQQLNQVQLSLDQLTNTVNQLQRDVCTAQFSIDTVTIQPILSNIKARMVDYKTFLAEQASSGRPDTFLANEIARQMDNGNLFDAQETLNDQLLGLTTPGGNGILVQYMQCLKGKSRYWTSTATDELQSVLAFYQTYQTDLLALRMLYMRVHRYPQRLVEAAIAQTLQELGTQASLFTQTIPEGAFVDTRLGSDGSSTMWWLPAQGPPSGFPPQGWPVPNVYAYYPTSYEQAVALVGTTSLHPAGTTGWAIPTEDQLTDLVSGWNSADSPRVQWLNENASSRIMPDACAIAVTPGCISGAFAGAGASAAEVTRAEGEIRFWGTAKPLTSAHDFGLDFNGPAFSIFNGSRNCLATGTALNLGAAFNDPNDALINPEYTVADFTTNDFARSRTHGPNVAECALGREPGSLPNIGSRNLLASGNSFAPPLFAIDNTGDFDVVHAIGARTLDAAEHYWYDALPTSISTAAPSVLATFSPAAGSAAGEANGWVRSAALGLSTVTNGAASSSGVRCVLDPASAPVSSAALPGSCAFVGDGAAIPRSGSHTLYVAVMDGAGTTQALETFGFLSDAVAPASRVKLDGDPLVRVSATDDVGGSGVTETRCVLDPASTPTRFDDLPASCPFLGAGVDVSTQGTHRLYVASQDVAGNSEAPALTSFTVGAETPSTPSGGSGGGSAGSSAPTAPAPYAAAVAIAPAASPAGQPTAKAGLLNTTTLSVTLPSPAGAAFVDFSTVDNYSAAKSFSSDRSGHYVLPVGDLPDGPHTIWIRFRDATGSVLAETTSSIVLDRTPPQLTRTTVSARLTKAGKRSVTVVGSDALAGVSQVQFAPALDRVGGWQAYRSTFTFPTSLRIIWVRVADAAGNVTPWRRLVLRKG